MNRMVKGPMVEVGNGNQQLEEGEVEEQLLEQPILSGDEDKLSGGSVVKRRSTRRMPTPRRLSLGSGSVVSDFPRPSLDGYRSRPPSQSRASQPSGDEILQQPTRRVTSVLSNKRLRTDANDIDVVDLVPNDNGDDKNENEMAVELENQKKVIQQLQQQLEAERKEKSDLSSQVESLKDEVQKQKTSQPLRGLQRHGSGSVISDISLHRGHEMRNLVARRTPELKRNKERGTTPVPNIQDNAVTVVHDDSLMTDLDDDFIGNKDEKRFLGMLEYRQVDLDKILSALISDLQPATALSAQPSALPAYILFMMIRHVDHIDNGNRVRSLINSSTKCIINLMAEREKSQIEILDVTVLWLSNTLRFMHLLNQYSGIEAFQQGNTRKQNEQCLRNLDLIEYRRLLNDHAQWIYMTLIKILRQGMQSMIVPAILENKEINSTDDEARGEKLDILIRKLDNVYSLLRSYDLDVDVIEQVFKQLSYYVCAQALNSLLQRKELCDLYTGLEIQNNISALEGWARSKKMGEAVNKPLRPVTQAGVILILEASKSSSKSYIDVTAICDACDDLTIQQVIKLLTLFSSKDGMDAGEMSEQKLFIERVRRKLLEKRTKVAEKQQLLMNTEYTFRVEFPFNHSSVKLEDVNIPDSFGVNKKWLKKM